MVAGTSVRCRFGGGTNTGRARALAYGPLFNPTTSLDTRAACICLFAAALSLWGDVVAVVVVVFVVAAVVVDVAVVAAFVGAAAAAVIVCVVAMVFAVCCDVCWLWFTCLLCVVCRLLRVVFCLLIVACCCFVAPVLGKLVRRRIIWRVWFRLLQPNAFPGWLWGF